MCSILPLIATARVEGRAKTCLGSNPGLSADGVGGSDTGRAASWRVKVRARPEVTLADASRCDVSRCKFVQPSLPVVGVVSETGEGDMLMGKIALTNACHKLDACCVSVLDPPGNRVGR